MNIETSMNDTRIIYILNYWVILNNYRKLNSCCGIETETNDNDDEYWIYSKFFPNEKKMQENFFCWFYKANFEKICLTTIVTIERTHTLVRSFGSGCMHAVWSSILGNPSSFHECNHGCGRLRQYQQNFNFHFRRKKIVGFFSFLLPI